MRPFLTQLTADFSLYL